MNTERISFASAGAMSKELHKAFEQGRQAYLGSPTDYENPYLEPYRGLKARKWDEGFEAGMVQLARGE